MAIRKSISILIIFVAAFALWVVLFAAAGISGIPARQLLEYSCPRPGLEVARIAFQTEGLKKADYVVAGTPDFVARASKDLPTSAKVVTIPLSTVTLAQYESVVDVFEQKSPTAFILQNAPHLWIDIDHALARGSQNTRSWKLHNEELTADTSLDLAEESLDFAEESFKALGAIVTKRCKKKTTGNRLPPDFLWTSFLPEPLMSRARKAFSPSVEIGKGQDQTRVIWVFDPSWIPADAMDDTRQALIAFATGPREEEGLGELVSFDRLNEYVQEKQIR
jgi:hypothetical protein